MTSEIQLIELAQDCVGDLKKALRDIQKENAAAGRHDAANAAMGLRGELIAWHARATEELRKHFPEMGADIQVRGGGGRGG